MANLLAGDVGATKVFLRVFDSETHHVLAEKRYLSSDFPSLSSLIKTFQSEFFIEPISVACLGVPGPVFDRQVHLTNLPWLVSAEQLEQSCGIGYVEILNDFSAAAYGIEALSETDLICLQVGDSQPKSNRVVVGAGSGLGVSLVKNCQGEFIPQPSEGGHIDFAPINERQLKLFNWLHKKWTHVSYERILSGEGIEHLYAFFNAENHGHSHFNLEPTLSAEQVHQLAISGDTIAQKTLDMFVEVYGAFIGNVALLWESKAGIYIAGGIGPKIQDWMEKQIFLDALCAKGRMKNWVKSVPVYLVMNEHLGLLGSVTLAHKNYEDLMQNHHENNINSADLEERYDEVLHANKN